MDEEVIPVVRSFLICKFIWLHYGRNYVYCSIIFSLQIHFDWFNYFQFAISFFRWRSAIIFSLQIHLIELKEEVMSVVRSFSVCEFIWLNYRKTWCLLFDHFQFANSFDSIGGINNACCSIIFSLRVHLIGLEEEIMLSMFFSSVIISM